MMKRYFVLLFLFCCVSVFASEPIRLGVISDVHFFSRKLVSDGVAYRNFQNATGRNVNDLHAVLDAVLSDFEKEKTDILLISGDLTNHGERESHLDLIEKLKPLQQCGTRIFVIPGNHDVNIPDAKAYRGDTPTPVKSISKEEFAELYAPFGYGSALKKDTASLSYLAEIDENTWLLCFDTNQYRENTVTSISAGRILPETMAWALEILHEARQKDITVLGMMHHGLVEHLPYQSTFFANYLVENWKKNAETLADAGLRVVFTGHFHANDVTLLTSPAGNIVYDVETASLAQYPFAYRVMQLCDDKLFIDTRFVTYVPGNLNLAEQARSFSENLIRRTAKNRINSLGIPLPAETADALAELIVPMTLLHFRGDEKPDDEMKKALRSFAELLGDEESDTDFELDFPPADNKFVINLGASISKSKKIE